MGTLRQLRRPICVFYVVFASCIFLCVVNMVYLNSFQRHLCKKNEGDADQDEQLVPQPVAWVRGQGIAFGYLSHVIAVLERLGYEVIIGSQPNGTIFDVLWHHEYPFSSDELQTYFKDLKPYQKINHIPGSGYYTSKVNLVTSDITDGIPKAFELPARKDDFIAYAKAHPELLWVKKNNEHRGIKIRRVSELDLSEKDSFVQQYISKPLLIDGRKFDVGIYTVITSVLPLRVYAYEGDALIRFCSQDYHPFDADNVNKYVVGDDYTPIWQMPSLKKYFVEQQMTSRQSLNAFIRSQGKDPEKIWNSMKDTIAEVFQSQQENMINSGRRFTDKRPFFELSRFDFVIDEDLNVFLMEANMSPNLSSSHFPQNRVLYEQVLLNLFSLVGVASYLHGNSMEFNFRDKATREMDISDRDLRVYGEDCAIEGMVCYGKESCKRQLKCQLCGHCMTYQQKIVLRAAYQEHLSRRNMRRILPATVHLEKHVSKMYSESDRLLILWFDAKCRSDKSWCS